jgi:predicted metal-dependent phosphoesterase TrpH
MDLVTLTDHDTIEGALLLRGRLDTFVSEEVTCRLPGGRELHLGVFDLDERQHAEIARRRADAESLFAYLAEQRLPVAANHLFSALTGRREISDLHLAYARATLVETRNGMMSPACNEAAREAARPFARPGCGGSDAHTLATVARAYTVVRARDREEYLAGLRAGRTVPCGRAGSYARFTADIARIVAATCADRWASSPATGAALGLAAAVLSPALPLVTLALWAHEQGFTAVHRARFLRSVHGGGPAAALRPAAAR